jgi:hypothetical protein
MLVVGEESSEKHSVVLDGDSDAVVDPLDKFALLGHLNWMQNIFNSIREDMKEIFRCSISGKTNEPPGERPYYINSTYFVYSCYYITQILGKIIYLCIVSLITYFHLTS